MVKNIISLSLESNFFLVISINPFSNSSCSHNIPIVSLTIIDSGPPDLVDKTDNPHDIASIKTTPNVSNLLAKTKQSDLCIIFFTSSRDFLPNK